MEYISKNDYLTIFLHGESIFAGLETQFQWEMVEKMDSSCL